MIMRDESICHILDTYNPTTSVVEKPSSSRRRKPKAMYLKALWWASRGPQSLTTLRADQWRPLALGFRHFRESHSRNVQRPWSESIEAMTASFNFLAIFAIVSYHHTQVIMFWNMYRGTSSDTTNAEELKNYTSSAGERWLAFKQLMNECTNRVHIFQMFEALQHQNYLI